MIFNKIYSRIGSKIKGLDNFIKYRNIKNSIFNVEIEDINFLMQFGDNSINGYKAEGLKVFMSQKPQQ